MRLLDVSAVLDRERDIQRDGHKTKVLEQLDDETAKYAILSHRWGMEVDYDGMTGLMKMNEQDRDEVRQRDGYRKIIKSCEQAKEDGYRWLWIDTAELSEAINSMYRWYYNSHMCYPVFPTQRDLDRFGRSNELIAPIELEFFNKTWDLTSTLQSITRIPKRVLRDGQVLRDTRHLRCSVAQMMSWAADRKTTRVEDRAYSLMGLFGVNMPMLYGEGAKAFQRLQLEIIRVNGDYSIFAWNPRGARTFGSVLAGDPSCFRDCHDIENGHIIML
ncbi:hypothetical protein EDD17DRAFT_1887576 [Pisolithus thermaeus]|nr:hypothetical protein EDD17DRAFT_1887576 [Pisolithus thermaeus]